MVNHKIKALSPLLATMVLIALVLTVGIFLSSSFSSMLQTEKEKTESVQSCSQASIIIQDVTCSNSVLEVLIQNTGNVPLSNFSIYFKISGNLYTNTTPVNYDKILSPGEFLTLKAYAPSSGNVERVVISTSTCPGVSAEVNDKVISVTC